MHVTSLLNNHNQLVNQLFQNKRCLTMISKFSWLCHHCSFRFFLLYFIMTICYSLSQTLGSPRSFKLVLDSFLSRRPLNSSAVYYCTKKNHTMMKKKWRFCWTQTTYLCCHMKLFLFIIGIGNGKFPAKNQAFDYHMCVT